MKDEVRLARVKELKSAYAVVPDAKCKEIIGKWIDDLTIPYSGMIVDVTEEEIKGE